MYWGVSACGNSSWSLDWRAWSGWPAKCHKNCCTLPWGLGPRDDYDTALPLKELETEAKATRQTVSTLQAKTVSDKKLYPQCLAPCLTWSRYAIHSSWLSWMYNIQCIMKTERNQSLTAPPHPFPWVFGEALLSSSGTVVTIEHVEYITFMWQHVNLIWGHVTMT